MSWKLVRDTRWKSAKCNNKPLSETVPQVTTELSVSTWQKGFFANDHLVFGMTATMGIRHYCHANDFVVSAEKVTKLTYHW